MVPWHARSSLVALAFCLVLFASPACAGWEADGGIICYVVGSQLNPVLTSDGAGGAIVAWEDKRDVADFDVYAQRVDALGRSLWDFWGVGVCTSTGDQVGIAILPDGQGGAFLAWADSRGGDFDIVAQRIDAAGVPQWVDGGVAVCTADYDQDRVVMIPDGAGGVILVWNDGRGLAPGLSLDVFAQRLDASGARQWSANGVPVVSLEGLQRNAAAIPDGAGGAYLAWEDTRNDTFENDLAHDIYAAHLVNDGHVGWEVTVLSAIYSQTSVMLVPGATGRTHVFWRDGRTLGDLDVYGSSFTATGGVLHSTDTARSIRSTASSEVLAGAVSDGAGGAIVLWAEGGGGDADLRAQRVDGDLDVMWGSGGGALCDATGAQGGLRTVSDGAGGLFAVWQDSRDGGDDLYAQRLGGSGAALWTPNGVAVCARVERQLMPALCADDAGGVLFAWHDERHGTPGDIFGHRIDAAGTLVPVQLSWYRARSENAEVVVEWQLVSSVGDEQWKISRTRASNAEVTLVEAVVTRPSLDRFELRDTQVVSGAEYSYRVERIAAGEARYLFVTEPIRVAGGRSELLMDGPNPARDVTRVVMRLGRSQSVQVEVFDLSGRRVARLFDGVREAGTHALEWDGRDLRGDAVSTGTYFVRMRGPDGESVRKVQRVH